VVVIRKTDTIVVGGGQAGLSLSYYLSRLGHRHVVLERDRIGDQWLSRWDSLRLLTPNWLNRLHGGKPHTDAHGFLSAHGFASYLRRYARSFGAPVYERAGVRGVSHAHDAYEVETERGAWRAHNLVLATGYAAEPSVPAIGTAVPSRLTQLHASAYRNPSSLPDGGVLVVGSGPSGQQIAAELRRAGRNVVLAVGQHSRSMRRYRGRDIWYWLYAIGDLHQTTADIRHRLVKKPPSLAVSGAHGGEQLDVALLAELGVTVTGRVSGFDGTTVSFAADRDDRIQEAELGMRSVLDRIDDHIADVHPDWPHAPDRIGEVRLAPAPSELDLAAQEIGTILWATGYCRDYSWLDVPGALDRDGEIVQEHGISSVPGLYTIGLNFQRYRASHFIGGVGADALPLARELVAAHAQRHGDPREQSARVPTGFAYARA
jgi:putative flavoprotein involved in K+ transport